MLRVLITGGSGFLGQEIRSALSEGSSRVTIVKRKSTHSNYSFYSLHPNEELLEVNWPSDIISLNLGSYDYIFYLSHAPVTQSQPMKEVLETNFKPLELFINNLRENKLTPQLVFISSQSASDSVNSNYAELKRMSENLLLNSNLPCLIFRPGLIFGSGNCGLFNSIKQIVRLSPVVPLIGSSTQVIQPLFVKDFVRVILKITGLDSGVKNIATQVVELADAPVSFHSFVKKVAFSMKKKRLFLPVPNSLVYLGLWILEHLFRYKKITTSSLYGYLQLSLIDHHKIWKEYGVMPTNLDDALEKAI